MKTERWQQISQLYDAALARDGSQRAAFLRGAPISNTDVFSYDVTKDGSRFIVNRYVKPSFVPPLSILLNATASVAKN